MIPHSRPSFNRPDQRAVKEVLRSGIVSAGPRVARAECRLAARTVTSAAAAVCSGTKALELAIRAMGLGAGDEIVVPSFCDASVLHAVTAAGAACVPADIEPETYHLDPGSVARFRTRRTRAVILTHSFGLPDDPAPFRRMGLKVIEDGAAALGARLGGNPVGSLGDVSIFSFCETNLIACGEGGMAVSRQRKLIDLVKELRRDIQWTDLQAALFSSQLKRLGSTLDARERIAQYYDLRLAAVGVDGPVRSIGRAYWRYVVRASGSAENLIPRFHAKGIVADRPISSPLHRALGFGNGFDVAEDAWRHCISLPLYPSLSRAERRHVADVAAALLSSGRL